MTIAACYVSPEGVVFGADSTASLMIAPSGLHFFNHNQKVFELGENSTLGVLTWGLGGIGTISYRSLFAEFSEDLVANPPASVDDVAARWRDKFWALYSTDPGMQALVARCRALDAKPPFDGTANPPDPNARTEKEEEEFQELRRALIIGFCVGGYVLPSRIPKAFVIQFEPLAAQPNPAPITVNQYGFWGAPNIFQRLVRGSDDKLRRAIIDSGKWGGTPQELARLLDQQRFGHPILPIREAIDFVNTCIFSTIKALKFSNFPQICGGPIELAVITTDRRFRWVRHKSWDTAIDEGALAP